MNFLIILRLIDENKCDLDLKEDSFSNRNFTNLNDSTLILLDKDKKPVPNQKLKNDAKIQGKNDISSGKTFSDINNINSFLTKKEMIFTTAVIADIQFNIFSIHINSL